MAIKDYCSKTSDNTCNLIKKTQNEKHNKQSCSASSNIFNSLKRQNSNINAKLSKLTYSKSCPVASENIDKETNQNLFKNNNHENKNLFKTYNRTSKKEEKKKPLIKNYSDSEKKNIKIINWNIDKKSSKNNTKIDSVIPGKCNIDLSKYIRKDQIPCWGCNLK